MEEDVYEEDKPPFGLKGRTGSHGWPPFHGLRLFPPTMSHGPPFPPRGHVQHSYEHWNSAETAGQSPQYGRDLSEPRPHGPTGAMPHSEMTCDAAGPQFSCL